MGKLLGLLLLVLPPCLAAQGRFLFGVPELETRNALLYERLRQQNVLEVLEDELANPTPLEVAVTNHEGTRFTCEVPGSGGAEEESEVADSEPPRGPEALLEALEDYCDTMAMGWWTYEWCHRKHIRQFHVDHVQGHVDPNWSLGNYVRTVTTNSTSGHVSLADHFEGGQHCDETGGGRNTRVEFQCCSHDASAQQGKKRRTRKNRSDSLALLTSIEEPDVCSYEVVICTPLVCGQGSENVTAFSLLEPLRRSCLVRHEGWWTYEFCYGRQIRQFHLIADGGNHPGASGGGSEVQTEYILGKADKAATKAAQDGTLDETQFLKPPSPEADIYAPHTLELEMGDGTLCELTGRPRATTVEFACGQTDAIQSVNEVHTCHYKVVISTQKLCKHPSFVQGSPPTRTLTCSQH